MTVNEKLHQAYYKTVKLDNLFTSK